MKFEFKIKLRTLRAIEATLLICLFAFAVLGVVGAWH